MPKGRYDKGAWLSRKLRPEFKKIKMQEGEVKIHCKRCKKTFLANNYRKQYCESCKEYLTKKRWREQKQKERGKEEKKRIEMQNNKDGGEL